MANSRETRTTSITSSSLPGECNKSGNKHSPSTQMSAGQATTNAVCSCLLTSDLVLFSLLHRSFSRGDVTSNARSRNYSLQRCLHYFCRLLVCMARFQWAVFFKCLLKPDTYTTWRPSLSFCIYLTHVIVYGNL